MRALADLSLGRAAGRLLVNAEKGDPGLPVLSEFLDLKRAASWLRSRLPRSAEYDPASLSAVRVLRHRPGRRCTLRFDFGDDGLRRLYVKVFRSKQANRVQAIHESFAARSPWIDLRLPGVLENPQKDCVVLLEELGGASLEEQFDGGADWLKGTEQAARALARLHDLRALPLPACIRTWTPQDELNAVWRYRSSLIEYSGLPHGWMKNLLHRLEVAVSEAAFSDAVILHRDLHPQQILLDGRAAGLIDLDNVAIGAPEIDLGNLLAHFDLFGLYGAADGDRFAAACHCLERTYASRRHFSRRALEVARAASLIRLAGLYATTSDLAVLSPGLILRAERFLERTGRPQ